MNWFTQLFGGTEAANHVVKTAADGIYHGIDKAIHTDEEKAEEFAARTDRFYTFVEKTFDENSVRNVTRRWLAWGVVGWILLNAQIAVGFAIAGKTEVVNRIIETANAFSLGTAFVTVLGAYFGVQFFRGRTK